jgi:hypothetical protein
MHIYFYFFIFYFFWIGLDSASLAMSQDEASDLAGLSNTVQVN